MRSILPLLLLSAAGFAQGPPPDQGQVPEGGPAQADQSQAPPDEPGPSVARISLINGDVSVNRGDSNTPVAATLNAPVLAGDVVATGQGARAEVEFDLANRLRIGNTAEARIAEMANGRYRIEVARGTVSFSVTRDTKAQTEISTPNVSIRPKQRGLYRVWVRDDGQTVVTVRAGEADIYTQKGTEQLGQGQTMFVRGSAQDPEFQVVQASQNDEWDNWNLQRDQNLNRATSPKYVNENVTGAEDLDAYGSWSNDPQYGQVWTPREPADWSPYGAGQWTWEDYYGWTWVSADPWGWAPYHYGNWYRGPLGWSWYPGPIYRPVFWRPALVAFFGYGGGFGIGIGFGGFGGIGWLPLAPFEVFHPWYGRGWFGGGFGYAGRGFGVNVTNVNITNIYRNARVPGAVRGVSASAFTSGQFRNISRVDAGQLQHAGLVRGAVPLTPSQNNLRFSDRTTSVAARSFANSRFTSVRPSASVQRTSFEQQRQTVQQSTQRFSSQAPSMNSRSAATSAGGQRFGTNSTSNPRSAGESSSWGRFGSPSRAAAPNATTASSYRGPAAQAQSSAGWNRFGTPSAAPNGNRYGSTSSYARSDGQSGYASRTSAYPQTGYGQRNFSQGAYGQGGSSAQTLRISPSIVHNRSYDQAPRSSGGGTTSRASAPSGGGHVSSSSHSSGGGGHHGK